MSAFGPCDAFVAAREGGYQADPDDPGNYYQGQLIGTNRGISAPVLAQWMGVAPTIADMHGLEASTAASIRMRLYWNPIRGYELPAGLDLMVYDDAVNRGVHAAGISLQSVLSVEVDGIIGPVTIEAAATNALRCAANVARMQIYEYLIDQRFATYGLGWLRRAADRFSTAMGMIV